MRPPAEEPCVMALRRAAKLPLDWPAERARAFPREAGLAPANTPKNQKSRAHFGKDAAVRATPTQSPTGAGVECPVPGTIPESWPTPLPVAVKGPGATVRAAAWRPGACGNCE